MDITNIMDYLVLVFGTKDKEEIANRLVGSPTLSKVSEAYSDYERYCKSRGIKQVAVNAFKTWICNAYDLVCVMKGTKNDIGEYITYSAFEKVA